MRKTNPDNMKQKSSAKSAKSSEPKKSNRQTVAGVPPDVLKELESGRRACANLTESLAVDQRKLAEAIGLHIPEWPDERIVKTMLHVASHMPDWRLYQDHTSDIVRGWATFALAISPELNFAEKCEQMKIFAADPHFGVREWAWLALRQELIDNLAQAIELLTPWTRDQDANIRRFASEATRPRGVWAAHIKVLKKDPSLALPILEPLRADPAIYVNDSVANWINDAAKDNPGWVRELCARWAEESDSPHTVRIIKRGTRSLKD